MNKFKFLDETMKSLGLSRQEVIDYLSNNQDKSKKNNPVLIDITKVEPGMFWYEDDSFSFDRVTDKKIKAIVEMVDSGVIYGDLTASELQDINEQSLNWPATKVFIDKFSYPCQENEEIVWYNIEQLEKVYGTYNLVKEAFCKTGKPFRSSRYYWSSTEYYSAYARTLYFYNGGRGAYDKSNSFYVRPVLALKVA